MAYRYTIQPEWTHVEYLGKVDSLDVVSQLGQPDFLDALSHSKKVIFDYSQATEIAFDEEDIKQFAQLGRLMGSAAEKVYAALIIMSAERTENAEIYKNAVGSDVWEVHICTNLAEATQYLQSV